MKTRSISLWVIATAFIASLASAYSFAGKLEEADLLFNGGAYRAAIPIYLEALADTGYSIEQQAEINYALGTAFFLERNNAEAVKYFRAARSQMPKIHDGRVFKIPSSYMEPQLKKGDMIIVNARYFQREPVRRYDVVTFLHPKKQEYMYVMRVIGMPGERIEIKEKQVIIDGKKVSEPFSIFSGKKSAPFPYDNFVPIKIPPNAYFLMGDNRDNSLDSRDFGVVDQRFIRGKALAIYATEIEDGNQRIISMERAGTFIK